MSHAHHELLLLPQPRKVEMLGQKFSGGELATRISPVEMPHPQGYKLIVKPSSIQIVGHDEAGVFYGKQTLAQLRSQTEDKGEPLPCLVIEDWPDFPARGVMLDISRDKVPTMATLFELVDLLASWKINQFQLYTEHTFAYAGHEVVWEHASPMTAEQVRELDAYCRERFVELVANQNSFGHMERWLKHAKYRDLAESPAGAVIHWRNDLATPTTFNPQDGRCLDLLDDLFDQLLPNFTSKQLNVGCDETWELGKGRSAALCEEKGTERVYLDFLLKIHERVARRGYTMQFWGDIILHQPELISQLPKDIVALNWGYEASHPFDKQSAAFAKSGVPFYVCPGTSAWKSVAGRTDNALGNLDNAAHHGLEHKAQGYLITDWGDHGHFQPQPVSYPGYAYGAGVSWCHHANRSMDLPAALDAYAFHDRAGLVGRALYDLGNVYKLAGQTPGNASAIFWFGGRNKLPQGVTASTIRETMEAIDHAIDALGKARMLRADAELVEREIRFAGALLRRLCEIALSKAEQTIAPRDAQKLLDEHRSVWLARNREGGLSDSLDKMREQLEDLP